MSEQSDGELDEIKKEFASCCALHKYEEKDLTALFTLEEIQAKKMQMYEVMNPGEGNAVKKLIFKIQLALNELRQALNKKDRYDSEAQQAFHDFLEKMANAEPLVSTPSSAGSASPSLNTSIAQDGLGDNEMFDGHGENMMFMSYVRLQESSDSESQF